MSRRIVVNVVLVHVHPEAGTTNRVRWQAQCATTRGGECTWTSALHHVRAGAEDDARYHRHTHRKAA